MINHGNIIQLPKQSFPKDNVVCWFIPNKSVCPIGKIALGMAPVYKIVIYLAVD